MERLARLERGEYNSSKIALHLSRNVIVLLKEEFALQENEIEDFITSVIERLIVEHNGETNSKVFSERETKELEENLKGLGYI